MRALRVHPHVHAIRVVIMRVFGRPTRAVSCMKVGNLSRAKERPRISRPEVSSYYCCAGSHRNSINKKRRALDMRWSLRTEANSGRPVPELLVCWEAGRPDAPARPRGAPAGYYNMIISSHSMIAYVMYGCCLDVTV